MECNELSLRELLNSAHGPAVGRRILDHLDAGGVVTMESPDGGEIRLTVKDQALRLLMDRFGWRPVS